MSEEIWKNIRNYEGYYQISNLGRVKSVKRLVNHFSGNRIVSERILKMSIRTDGYFVVTLRNGNGGKVKCVHHLVLENFVGERPELMVTCHNDGNKLNNNVKNLSWGSYSKNNGSDRLKHGTDNRGEKHGMAINTESQAKDVMNLINNTNYSLAEISRKTGVNYGSVVSIMHGKSWTYLGQITRKIKRYKR